MNLRELAMMIAAWYKQMLIIWVLVATPCLALAYGFGGGSIQPFDVRGIGSSAAALTIFAWLAVFSPLICLPFAIRRKSRSAKSDKEESV